MNCVAKLAVLSERDTEKNGSFRMLIAHVQVLERLHRRSGELRRVVRQIQLKVNLGFVKVTECGVALACVLLEEQAEPSKLFHVFHVPPAKKVQIGSVVAGLRRELAQSQAFANLLRTRVKVVRLLK